MLVEVAPKSSRALAHLGDGRLRPNSICRRAFNDRRLLCMLKNESIVVHDDYAQAARIHARVLFYQTFTNTKPEFVHRCGSKLD